MISMQSKTKKLNRDKTSVNKLTRTTQRGWIYHEKSENTLDDIF